METEAKRQVSSVHIAYIVVPYRTDISFQFSLKSPSSMSDTVTATRFLSRTIHNAIVFKRQLNIHTQDYIAFIKVLFVRYRNCIITLKTGVKRIVNRWDVFQIKFIEIGHLWICKWSTNWIQ